MGYPSLRACIEDLERHGHLIRIREEVDPHLEMAAIQMRVYEAGGPAILYDRVKGTAFPAVSNLFGTLERSRFIFRDSLARVQTLVELKYDPIVALRRPLRSLGASGAAVSSLPMRSSRRRAPVLDGTTSVGALPRIVSWPRDGGPFITLPQVYTEDPDRPGVMKANVGMYRVQLGGNEYEPDGEVGLHFLGLSWLHTRGSALIGWVGRDAEFLARRIAERAGRSWTGRMASRLWLEPPRPRSANRRRFRPRTAQRSAVERFFAR